MTKDLTPKDDKTSPLRELDWQDDDFAMEVVADRIFNRDLDAIFDNQVLLNDRGGETVYMPSMAEHGDHNIKIAIPPKLLLLLEQIALKYHDLELSDSTRISLVHGMSIYEYKFGAEIERLYFDNTEAHIHGDNESMMCHLFSANIDFKHVRYSCRLEHRVFQLLSKFAAHSGCGKQYMCGLWILYSLRTHPRMSSWITEIDPIINDFESAMKLRIKFLTRDSA